MPQRDFEAVPGSQSAHHTAAAYAGGGGVSVVVGARHGQGLTHHQNVKFGNQHFGR